MYKCKHCGKEFTKQGSLNLHEYRCKENPDSKKNASKVKEKKKNKYNECPNCGGEMRFLTNSDVNEREAIKGGYTLICESCTWIIE